MLRLWGYLSHPRNSIQRDKFLKHRPTLFSAISAVNFFFGFCVLFYTVLVPGEFNVILTILSLILLRQVMQRLMLGVLDGFFLTERKNKINALFYTNLNMQSTTGHSESSFDFLLRSKQRTYWFEQLFSETEYAGEVKPEGMVWRDLPSKTIGCFELTVDTGGVLYIKVFGIDSVGQFKRELMFHEAFRGQNKAVPVLLKSIEYNGFNFLLLKGRRSRKPLSKERLETTNHRVRKYAMDI